MPRICPLIALFFASLLPAAAETVIQKDDHKQVLVLQSRKEANVWTAKINQQLSERFESDETEVRLESVRYQTLGREDYLEGFLSYLRAQYSEKKTVPPPDVVVAVGRAALDFAIQNRPELFPDSPIVYSGPDESPDTLPILGLENATAVLMESEYARNVELMRTLHPQRDQIFILFEDSIDGRIHESYANDQLAKTELGKSKFHFVSAAEVSTLEAISMIRAVENRAAVLVASWALGNSEQSTKRPVVTLLSAELQAPLYDLSTTSLGFGIVGGMLATPEAQADATAEVISRILNGEAADSIPLQTIGSGRPFFDYKQLEEWGISTDELPEGSTVINRPNSLWYDYREYVLGAIALIILQTIAVTSLTFAYRARKRLEKERARNEAELRRKNEELEENLARTHTLTRELRLANQAKSDFLSVMNHELRTPLNAVIGLSDLLLEENWDEEEQDYLRTINQSGQKLLSMVNRILNYSNSNPNERPVKSKFNLGELLSGVARQFGEKAAEKGLELRVVNIASANQTQVLCDEWSLTQILNNFVDNAIKFTESGRITITAFVFEGARIRIEVSDTGIGIAPETKEQIFAPFQMGDPSRTRRAGGIGLGLALCQINASQMEADLGVTSEPQGGSRFWIELGGVVCSPVPSEAKHHG